MVYFWLAVSKGSIFFCSWNVPPSELQSLWDKCYGRVLTVSFLLLMIDDKDIDSVLFLFPLLHEHSEIRGLNHIFMQVSLGFSWLYLKPSLYQWPSGSECVTFCFMSNYITASIASLSVGCFMWQTSNNNYSLSFGLMMILIWRERRAWSHCLLGKIASCEIAEFIQKWVLFSESCPALSLGAVRWTLMDQRAPKFPSALPPALQTIISFPFPKTCIFP